VVLVPTHPSIQRLLRPSSVAAEQVGVEPDPSATAVFKVKNALIFTCTSLCDFMSLFFIKHSD